MIDTLNYIYIPPRNVCKVKIPKSLIQMHQTPKIPKIPKIYIPKSIKIINAGIKKIRELKPPYTPKQAKKFRDGG